MEYFIDVVNFVDKYLFWVITFFLSACLVEFIVFLCKKKGGRFNTDGFFICLVTNLFVTLGLYVLACLGVGLVNCLKAQDWHFWSNYMSFLQGSDSKVVFGIVFAVAVIFFMIKYDIDSFLVKLIAAALSAALATLAAVVVGFVLYVTVSVVIVILKVLWFVISGFVTSIFQFVIKYWKMSIVVLCGPGVIYGACCAFMNYLRSFKSEVGHK